MAGIGLNEKQKGKIVFGLYYLHGNTQVTSFRMSGHRKLKEREPHDCHYIKFVDFFHWQNLEGTALSLFFHKYRMAACTTYLYAKVIHSKSLVSEASMERCDMLAFPK